MTVATGGAAVLLLVAALATSRPDGDERRRGAEPPSVARPVATPLRIDVMAQPRARQRTAAAPGWVAYHGEPYSASRGYGWVQALPPDSGADRGEDATIVLPTGVRSSARLLGRPELAHWQGTHRENHPLVFRVNLANGWYRVGCASVDPGRPLPLVDQRGFKCRAHDAVFAGSEHGRPLATTGPTLVEGEGVVEVSDGQLRIVVGDPAYPGWTWRHPGAWYEGWGEWWGRWGGHRYAEHWSQKLTRTVDPGFHSLRLNALRIDAATPPASPGRLVFRDHFNRDDAADLNRGLPEKARWQRRDLDDGARPVVAALDKTSLTLTAASPAKVAFVQGTPSPARGVVRYRTRVTLAAGEGGRAGRGVHEAGLLLLADPAVPADTHATFVGMTVAGDRPSGLTVRVGDRAAGYRADVTIAPPRLPVEAVAGEYELELEHDVTRGTLSRIAVNDVDVTDLVPRVARHQPVERGVFGVRAAMAPGSTGGALRQSYWLYRVDCVPGADGRPSC